MSQSTAGGAASGAAQGAAMGAVAGPIGMGVGALVGAAGGFLGAQGANRSGRQARDLFAMQGARGMGALSGELYGTDGLEQILASLEPGWRERYLRDQFGLNDDHLNGINLEKMSVPELIQYARAQGVTGVGNAGGYAGYFPTMQALGQEGRQRGQGMLEGYNQRTGQLAAGDAAWANRIDDLGLGAELMARDFGHGANDVIDTQMGRAIKQANQTAAGRAIASGLGTSTILANQQGQNVLRGNEAAAAQKVGVQQAMTDRLMTARGQRMGAMERVGGQNRLNAYNRDAGRVGLENINLDRDLQLAAAPVERRLQVQQGPVMNPWLGQNTMQYYPGMSPGGTALTSLGNTAAGMGSLMTMASLYPGLYGNQQQYQYGGQGVQRQSFQSGGQGVDGLQ